jgi:hypothetical protein
MTHTIPGRKITQAERDYVLKAAWARRCFLAAEGRSETDMVELASIDHQIAVAHGVGPVGRKVKSALLLALCNEGLFDKQETILIRTLIAACEI